MTENNIRPTSIRILRLVQALRNKVCLVWEMLESAIAMGLTPDQTFRQFDTYPFDETEDIIKLSADHHLERWEHEASKEHIPTGGTILVAAAGGLRELLGLHGLGYQTIGVEYGTRLCEVSRDWLDQHGLDIPLHPAKRYEIPELGLKLDSAFVARHFYSHIRTRSQRIQFLSSIRSQLNSDARLILSYYTFEQGATFQIHAAIANLLRRLIGQRGETVEVGDHMDPDSSLCHRHFVAWEVEDELKEAGFDIVGHGDSWFGWAIAQPTPKPNARVADQTTAASELTNPAVNDSVTACT